MTRPIAVLAASVFVLASAVVAQSRDSSMILADRIAKSEVPVLVDFWAAWCGPCRIMAPTIKALEKEYAGRIKVMKIDVDVHRQIAGYFRVSAIPAVFIIKNKTVVKYLPGLQPAEAYKAAINEVLTGAEPAPVPGVAEEGDEGET